MPSDAAGPHAHATGLPSPVVAFRSARPTTLRERFSRFYAAVRKEVGPVSFNAESLPWTDSAADSAGQWEPTGLVENADGAPPLGDDADEPPVDQIVVDNMDDPETWLRNLSEHSLSADGQPREEGDHAWGGARHGGATLQKRETEGANSESGRRTTTFRDYASPMDWYPVKVMGTFMRCSLKPIAVDFFAAKYPDPAVERAFQKETWYAQKSTHIAGSILILVTNLIQIGLQTGTVSMFNRVGTYLLAPLCAFCMVFMALFNVPYKKPLPWQAVSFFAVWLGSCGFLIDLWSCDYYGKHPVCFSRDFLTGFLYATAFPTLALFALGQKRFLLIIGILIWIIVASALVVPQNHNFLRDMLPWALFMAFILFFHYARETSDRRTYSLRLEVKVQYRAKQKAQINERKSMEAKKRFFNYIFHECRVPLNTALLAFQNLKASKVFSADSEYALEYAALQSSLAMMRTVLDDVLDVARMEKGGFSSVRRPFSFHHVMRSILGPLKMDASARGLELHTSLDKRIDEVAVNAMRFPKDVEDVQEGQGIMLGDETRLRQVINNLASNACKFSTKGGRITFVTKLVFPKPHRPPSVSFRHPDSRPSAGSDSTAVEEGVELSELAMKEEEQAAVAATKSLVVRVEVHDTGIGIRQADTRDGAMFSPFHQNQQTLQQGGKGTGLGLSLVKHIVALSGGRLGVQSQAGKGSCLWFEYPLGTISPEDAEADIDFAAQHSAYRQADLATPNTYSEHSEYGFATPPLQTPAIEQALDLGNQGAAKTAQAFSVGGASSSFQLFLPPQPSTSTSNPAPASPTLQSPAPATPSVSPPSRPEESSLSPDASPLTLRNVPLPASSLPKIDSDPPIRVLAVDDDSLTRKLMTRMLARLGAAVTTAEDGAAALELILERPPDLAPSEPTSNYDLILLDNQMPKMTGIQLAARLRKLGRNDMIVGVTANAVQADQDEFLQAGAQAVLTKPVREGDLKRLLAKQKARINCIGPESSDPPNLSNHSTDTHPASPH